MAPRKGSSSVPPLLAQYQEIKRKHPEELLLFRLGDFYEMFFDDAKIASQVLGITLTSKPVGKGIRVPLAGIPVKAAESYIAKLLQSGYKVAICEQVEGTDGNLMRREVVEVITPGTVLSEALLRDKEHNYLASVVWVGERVGAAVCDLTTGDLFVFETGRYEAQEELENLKPAEVLIPEDQAPLPLPGVQTPLPEWEFELGHAEEEIRDFFGTAGVEGFGIRGMPLAVRAAGALVGYLKEKKSGMLAHITGIRIHRPEDHMLLDPQTVRNLELVEKIRPDMEGLSLLDVLDLTLTPMGGRELRSRLLSPLLRKEAIEARLDRVQALYDRPDRMEALEKALRDIGDIERLLSRISARKAGPRELRKLALSLKRVPEVFTHVADLSPFQETARSLPNLTRVVADILDGLVEDPPPTSRDGGFIRDGYDPALDEVRTLARTAKEKLMEIEQKERARTGIPNLRIGYNNVFGYYIEVTKAHLHRVPPDYVRKQTLTGAERFITAELKTLEDKVLGAEERAVRIEEEHLSRMQKALVERSADIKAMAQAVADLDVALALAQVARRYGYTRPRITEDLNIRIREGRHPVVERLQQPFVPNDIVMKPPEAFLFIVTGPNMSGKSTFLRQVALTVILAQMGAFVPAKEAEIGIVDRVFTRIGASDDLSRGISTFMAEMVETAQILHNATPRSLVILDEVGRGTATFDGLAIAWAVAEYIARKIRAKTLFATHFHELARLAEKVRGVRNLTVEVREWEGKVVFLHRVIPGVSDQSYGIHVAELAGLPHPVIRRARAVLQALQRTRTGDRIVGQSQMDLFDSPLPETSARPDPLREVLARLNPDELTPRQALEWLYKLKELAGAEKEERL